MSAEEQEIEIEYVQDINQVCRLCMSTAHLEKLEDDSLLVDFECVTAIDVKYAEDVQLCPTCLTYLNKIGKFKDFVKKCRDTDRVLKEAAERLEGNEYVKIEMRKENGHVIETKVFSDENVTAGKQTDETLDPSKFESLLSDALLSEFNLDEDMTLWPVTEEDGFLQTVINSNCHQVTNDIIGSNVEITNAESQLDSKNRKPTCHFCGVLVDNLREHRRINKACQFKCEICGFTSCRNSNLQQHIENRHQNQNSSYRCPFCPITVKHRISLKRHLLIHECDTRQECDVCKQCFKSPKALKRHMKQHTSPTLTDYCRKNSAIKRRPSSGKPKEKTDHKEFVCEICNEKFGCRAQLYCHSIIHKEKNLVCDQCSYRTNRHRSLIDHLKTHSSQRCYKCDVCTKSFKQSAQLYKHKLIHSDRKYICRECGKKFTQKSHLDEHERRHESNVTFFCHVCTKGFYNNPETKRHIRKVHGEDELKKYVSQKTYDENDDEGGEVEETIMFDDMILI